MFLLVKLVITYNISTVWVIFPKRAESCLIETFYFAIWSRINIEWLKTQKQTNMGQVLSAIVECM